MSSPTPGFRDYLLLISLGAIWGASFLLIELALRGFQPLTLASVRIALAALTLLAACRLLPVRFPREPSAWAFISAIGAINVALPFFLISWGQQTIDPSQSAILMATAPLMVALMSPLVAGGEAVARRTAAGLALGFLAVVILLAPGAAGGALVGQLAVLAAAFCYALSALMIARVGDRDPLAVGVILFGAMAIVMLPLSLFLERPWQSVPEPVAVLAIVVLGVVSTALAFYMRIHLIQRQGPVFLAQVGYQIPLFGVFWSWVGLGQTPALRALVALVLLVAGMWLTRRRAPGHGVHDPASLR